jgi:MscS family membrane protein
MRKETVMNKILEVFHLDQSRFELFFDLISQFFSSQEWAMIFLVILVTFIIHHSMSFFIKKLSYLAGKTKTELDDIIVNHSIKPLRNYVTLYGATVLVEILKLPISPINFENIFETVLKVGFVVNSVWLAIGIIDTIGGHFFKKAIKTSSKLDEQLLPIFQKTTRFFIYLLGIVYVIQMLGYSISAIVTGLGIGGLAVAMAAKDTLSNLFGSIMIFIDRPFKLGDWITVNGEEGVVEEIGFRSTRIRTFAKTVISLPNSSVVMNSINNYSRMPKRRIKMTIGLTYGSSVDQMEKVTSSIEEYLKNSELVHPDQIMVNFTNFGSSSLDIFIYFFTRTTKWQEYLEARQTINLSIMKIVENEGLSFAFPTQTLHIESRDEKNS